MINSKKELKYYLTCDRIALGIKRDKVLKSYVLNYVYRYQRLLRIAEYYNNCSETLLGKGISYLMKYRLLKLGHHLGFSIPLNAFGPGLSIAHCGTIVVNSATKVGSNCRLHVCVNIGTAAGEESLTPIIGNNVYIGPGSKIFGSIKIADGITIGANSVVNKSFSEENITIVGVPAKKISSKGSKGLLIEADKTFRSQNES